MPGSITHIKDLDKFPFTPRFHVKVLNFIDKSEIKILTTKDLGLATKTARKKKGLVFNPKQRVIVTKERIIQMY